MYPRNPQMRKTGKGKPPPRTTLLISGSRANAIGGPRNQQMRKMGGASRYPARPYCSGVRSLTFNGFEQAPQITRVRDVKGTRIRAFPRAHWLEGASLVVFESQRGQLAGGIPPRESFRALSP
jgi:hypothetical protein